MESTHAPMLQVCPSEHCWQAEPNEPQERLVEPPWQRPAESQQPVAQVELSHLGLAPHAVKKRRDAPSAKVMKDL